MRRLASLGLALGLALLTTSAARADDELKVGDRAPEFEAKDDTGKVWKSADHVGKTILVVYFYPADFTGGCTKQACGFRDDMKKLADENVAVVGVSGDSAKTHEMFKKAHGLKFTLLADEEGTVARKFGVPVSPGKSITRQIDGQEHTLTRGVTAARWTYLIDKEGKIVLKNTQVNAANDSKAILRAIKDLQ